MNMRTGADDLPAIAPENADRSLRDMLYMLSERMRHLATRSEVRELACRVAVLEERMSHTATKAWVLGGAVAVLVAMMGGFWWIVQQYLSPLLRAAG
jgi:hypothetical protein